MPSLGKLETITALRSVRVAAAVGLMLAVTAGAARAQSCGPLPNTLTNNTTADATQVMGNLNTLLNCINSNGSIGTSTAGQVAYYGASGNALSGISLSNLLNSAFGTTQGAILYRGSSGWTLLPPGTSGYVLQTGGTSTAPSWVPPATGGGGISTVVGAGVSSSAATIAIPGVPVITRPALSTFTWLNQASATATDHANGPLVLQTAQNSSSANVSALIKPVAGSNWTVTVEYAQGNQVASDNYAGLVIYNSSNGRLYVCGLNGAQSIGIGAYANVTSYPSNTGSLPILLNPGAVWIRAQYVSATTTLTFSYSIDGFTWSQIYSTASPYVGVPTGYGLAVDADNNANGYIVSTNYFVDSSP